MIQSVVRAFRILETIHAGAGGEMGLAEIAQRLSLEKSTVHNLVKTLRTQGYVEQDGEGQRYRLGTKLFALGHGSVHEDAYLRDLLGPLVRELREVTDENVSLAALRRGRLHILCRELSDREIHAVPTRIKPFYSTLSGRCLLAQASDEQVDAILAADGWPDDLWDGIRDRAALRAELGKIRRAGFAVLRSERREIGGVGFIVEADARFRPLAIGTALPLYRFRKRKNSLLKQVGRTAEKMALLLGQTAGRTAAGAMRPPGGKG